MADFSGTGVKLFALDAPDRVVVGTYAHPGYYAKLQFYPSDTETYSFSLLWASSEDPSDPDAQTVPFGQQSSGSISPGGDPVILLGQSINPYYYIYCWVHLHSDNAPVPDINIRYDFNHKLDQILTVAMSTQPGLRAHFHTPALPVAAMDAVAYLTGGVPQQGHLSVAMATTAQLRGKQRTGLIVTGRTVVQLSGSGGGGGDNPSGITLPPLNLDVAAYLTGGAVRELPADATISDTPIGIALSLSGTLERLPPPLALLGAQEHQSRLMEAVSLSLPTPAIVEGRPMLPSLWGTSAAAITGVQGPAHIHAIADPDPQWNPATSGWYNPVSVPSAGVGDARWTVNTLPDPAGFGNGYYWLGDPDSRDYTAGINPAARQWAPDASTPGAPAWRSRFPYKPSVWPHVHYGAGGRVLTISRGVRFNLQFVEHMWMDWARAMPQPFTWAMVGILMDWPSNSYTHYLLDSGRDYRSVGFPELSDSAVMGGDRGIAEEVGYRNLMAVNINSQFIGSTDSQASGSTLRTRFNMAAKPRMFWGVYNGSKSMVGNYSADAGKIRSAGKILSAGQEHRYYVMGRRHGHIGNANASHLVVFEIRFWHRALSLPELDAQYGQLSSTWKFNQY